MFREEHTVTVSNLVHLNHALVLNGKEYDETEPPYALIWNFNIIGK
jgi:hypothetical protein